MTTGTKHPILMGLLKNKPLMANLAIVLLKNIPSRLMSKYTILATNDDGIDSPLFLYFLDSLRSAAFCKELRFVAPAEEHSWIAQAATPKRPVFTSSYQHQDTSGFVISGTPADCVSLGAFNLYSDLPDFVFSGINVGSNAGLPFYLSSGTIGACRQGFLHGIPSIAFSVKTPPEVFKTWGRHDLEALSALKDDWIRIARQCVRVAALLVENFSSSSVDLFSVNMPWAVDANSSMTLTMLQRGNYQELFSKRAPNEFMHDPKGLYEDNNRTDDSSKFEFDREVMAQGGISVCPIRYELQPSDEIYTQKLRELLETT